MGYLPAGTQMGSEYYRVADMETRVESLFHSFALVVSAFILGTFLIAGAGSILSALGFDVESTATLPPLAYAALTATQFVGFFAVIAAYLRWRSDERFFRAAVPSLRDLGWVVAGFVGLFAVATALSAVIQSAGVDSATNQVITQGQRDPVRFLYLIPVTFLFVAPAEELLFRGIVQGLFRRAYGVVPAVVLASAVFGAMHYFALLGSEGSIVSSLALTAALGLVLGALYELSGNIAVPIVVHGLWNTMSFLLQYLQATGVVG
ncbi:CPBP family intramembrane glutamic endopeptidase [Halosimplex marinum]|uniref:CPBP family intramembrane glutamic endopeptidase n=1 Tax=Halosimplex marinum TaxID=3396620 RepID=UPI003F56E789